MADLTSKRSSKDVVGRSKNNDIRCKKHPKHKQPPGVCSLCLREKLSQLSSTSTKSSRSNVKMESSCSSSSLSSYYSSSSASSCASPMHRYRFTREGKHSFSTLLFGRQSTVLTKSRSVACVIKDGDGKQKKAGLFSKLLRPRSKKVGEDLVHSRATREIGVTG